MKSSFHLVYRYIFCLPSRRSGQIIGLTPRIIYSLLLLLASFHTLTLPRFLDRFVGSTRLCLLFLLSAYHNIFFDLLARFTLPCVIYYYSFVTCAGFSKNTLHTYQNVPAKNSDNYSHNYCI